MQDLVFKRNMNIGTISAENDKEFLSKCFLATPEYEELLDFENKKMIILGRTGSGKTALLNKMEEKADVYIKIRPDNFALQYISNVPFVKRLKEEGLNLDIFYKFLWMHEIISSIIKNYFAYNKRKFLDELSTRVTDVGRISQLNRYLTEYENIFFDEGVKEKITDEIEKKLSAGLGNDIAKIMGEFSETQKKEIQSITSQYINQKQIKQLKNIITLLKEYFDNNRQRKIIVVIDDLDENWIEDDSKYQLISSLLDAIRLFVEVPNLKILIALRADVLSKTCNITKRQNEKDNAFTLKLNWNKSMLAALLNYRISYLFTHKYSKNLKTSFNEIFNCNMGDCLASDYVLERTMMRPRDAISFVNYCIAEAGNSTEISKQHILNAERIFLDERLKALNHEWGGIYQAIDIYIRAIYEMGNLFTYFQLLEIVNYERIERILYASRRMDDHLIKVFLNADKNDYYSRENVIKEFLNILFSIGILGIKYHNENPTFSTPNKPILNELDYTDTLLLQIHPLFAKRER